MLATLSPVKYSFSGHDTFHCHSLSLTKGYDYLLLHKKLSDDDALVMLGVGMNTVSAIRYWMKAFNRSDSDDQPTELAHWIFDDKKGLASPYLEDEGTLWLLHFHLVTNNHASIYNLIFNTYRRLKIEFSTEDFSKYMGRLSRTTTEARRELIQEEPEVFKSMLKEIFSDRRDDPDEKFDRLLKNNFERFGRHFPEISMMRYLTKQQVVRN